MYVSNVVETFVEGGQKVKRAVDKISKMCYRNGLWSCNIKKKKALKKAQEKVGKSEL